MAKRNSSDIAADLAEQMGISKTAAKAYTEYIFDDILSYLEQGDEVSILKFGRFRIAVTAPRNGMNLHTRKKGVIPAKTRLKFEMSRWLRDKYDEADRAAGPERSQDDSDSDT